MHTHLPGYMRQHFVAIFEFDTKHRVGQRFNNRSLQDNRIFLWLWQVVLLTTKVCVTLWTVKRARTAQGRRKILARLRVVDLRVHVSSPAGMSGLAGTADRGVTRIGTAGCDR